MTGSDSFRIEVQILDNTSDEGGNCVTVSKRGRQLTIADITEAFTDALKGAGFSDLEVSIN
jgi:hypothetical protein